MSSFVLLPSPSANRVYAHDAPRLAAAELAVCAPWAANITVREIAGLRYVGFDADELDDDRLVTVARSSSFLALFGSEADVLRPLPAPPVNSFDDDLVTIPKYPGKTNEQFTRLLVNVTTSQVRTTSPRKVVLDPLAGRGTTLTTSWLLGHDAAGVEADAKSVEAMAAFVTTWLRRKRIKHRCETVPVRRDGKSVGKRFDAHATGPTGEQTLTVFTGDTTDSAKLWGKRRFDAIVTDAPYGVAHGAHTGKSRQRSPRELLTAAIEVWARQLKSGGALGIAWNTYGMTREELIETLGAAGLQPRDSEEWRQFAHRVDSSIHRDLVVACTS